MKTIYSYLSVIDPSFQFNIDFRGCPYDIRINAPEGQLNVVLRVPNPDDFDDDSGTNFVLLKPALIEALKGDSPWLGITCPIDLRLKTRLDTNAISRFEQFQLLLNDSVKTNREKKDEIRYDFSDIRPISDKLFAVLRKYFRKTLLTLREEGNFCRIRFFDYDRLESDQLIGLFGTYYYDFRIADESDNTLYQDSPLLPKKSKEQVAKLKYEIPLYKENPDVMNGYINEEVWKRIIDDMKDPKYQPDISKTFLLDAHDEVLSTNYNIAIISTAVACEIMTKRYISHQAKLIKNEFYDYVIENTRDISVPELLDKPLKSLTGHSVKEQNRDLWKELVTLFQVRNKIVHTGERYYPSITGKTKHQVDGSRTLQFIKSVYELIEVLSSSSYIKVKSS